MKLSVAWLRELVDLKPPAESVAERLTLAGLEVEKVENPKSLADAIFQVEVTSNRPDWLSHIGVAREIAAVENLRLKLPEVDPSDTHKLPHGMKVTIKDPAGCPYYSGLLFEGIKMEETPNFIKERLVACGLRSINLIVDITNYVLLECGQPMHAFDADLLNGKDIVIRKAKPKEKLIAINESELELTKDDLVIADEKGPIALAGVMGGKETEVNMRTRNIFLESAYFTSGTVRSSARRHFISSESSYRFERKIDPQGVEFARQRALFLIKKYAKPTFVSTVIKMGSLPTQQVKKIHLVGDYIRQILGLEIKSADIRLCLLRLELDAKQKGVDTWEVAIPTFRSDLLEPIDLVEEIARIYGFDKIPLSLPSRSPIKPEANLLLSLSRKSRAFFAGAGLFETVTFSLVDDKGIPEADLENTVRIVNPMNKELQWMRSSLFASLMNVAEKNYSLGAEGVPIFEIANTYELSKNKKGPVEKRTLGILISGDISNAGWLDQKRKYNFYDLKGILEAYFASVSCADIQFKKDNKRVLAEELSEAILFQDKEVGCFGKVCSRQLKKWNLDTDVFYAEIDLELITPKEEVIKKFVELPKFPSTSRDLSIVVPEATKSADIEKMIQDQGQGLIQSVELFDIFRGGRVEKGYKNMAYRVLYQSAEKTLMSEDVQELHSNIGANIAQKFEASFQ
jgi:phenylalanyl-tRNA synthetase beta chain